MSICLLFSFGLKLGQGAQSWAPNLGEGSSALGSPGQAPAPGEPWGVNCALPWAWQSGLGSTDCCCDVCG